MKTVTKLILALSLLTAMALTAQAADPQNLPPEGSGRAGENEPTGGSIPHLQVNKAELEENGSNQLPLHPELLALDSQVRNPMMERIQEILAQSDVRLVELQTSLDSQRNNTEALDIVKSIEQLKIRTELDIMAVQASFARQGGFEEVALEIEAALSQMTSPRPQRQPVDRPAPSAGNH